MEPRQGRQILAGPGTGSDAGKSIAHFRHAGHTAIAVCCSDHFLVNIRNLDINLLAIRTTRTALLRQIQCESRPCTAFLQFSGSPFFAIILISHVIAFGAIIWIFYVISIIWIFHVIAFGAIIWIFM